MPELKFSLTNDLTAKHVSSTLSKICTSIMSENMRQVAGTDIMRITVLCVIEVSGFYYILFLTVLTRELTNTIKPGFHDNKPKLKCIFKYQNAS